MNCVKREKLTLRYIMQLRIKWKCLRPLRSTISNELIMTESVTSLSVLKKSNLIFSKRKKTQPAFVLQRLEREKQKI